MDIQRESIFITALRSFTKTIAIVIAIFVAFIPISFLFSLIGGKGDISSKTTLNILPDADGNQNILPESKPAILQIKIHGVIGAKELTNENIEHVLVDSRKNMLKNNRIKGILLNINSPGGAVFDSDSIYRLISDYKKRFDVPVFAYVDGLCASGAMYIACAADQIYSSPVGIIGSVGVLIGPFFNFKDAMDKWGIDSKTLTIGENKAAFNPFKKWTEDEGVEYQNIIEYVYERFINIVTKSRTKISKQNLVNVYGAKVFNAQKAQEIGFIDNSDGSYRETLKALVDFAGITSQYQVVELTLKSSFISSLIDSQAKLINNIFQLPNYKDQVSFLYKPTF
jgi:protease IV